MALSDMLFGKSAELKAIPTMAPEQQALFSQLLGGLGGASGDLFGYLRNMLSGGAEAFEAPAMRQFQESIIPGIAERFSGMGAGAQSSSAFQQALGSAGAGLAEQLAMQRAGLQQSALGPLMSLFQMGTTTPTFQWQQMPGTEGALKPLMSALGSIFSPFGSALGSGLAGLLPGGGGFKAAIQRSFGG